MSNVEPIILLLFAAMVFFTGCLFAAEHFFASDSQLFQVISGLLTGISGAFLMRVKPLTDRPVITTGVDDPKTSQTTIVTKEVAKDGPQA